MTELMDLRMHHHLALQTEIYRQQMLQRLPDPYPTMLPVPAPRPLMLPPRFPLSSDVDIKLQNKELWSQFHRIGTEMIITKSGRRMFPSMRLSINGLEAEENYCVLIEMVPISDCRFKFSGSQWVPAGGAEPQSPQRMYLHPDSPSLGSHWTSQPVVFNKVKLTNNTLDSNGHIVLTSMHKYQPRIHVIKTSDPSQIPWSPQSPFTFPETEFVAVTAYQNDRITKLKIDNNPFAKGFRETGQSRCKRKAGQMSTSSRSTEESEESGGESGPSQEPKRLRIESGGSLDDSDISVSDSSSGTSSPVTVDDLHRNPHEEMLRSHSVSSSAYSQNFQHMLNPAMAAAGWMDLMFPYFQQPHLSLPPSAAVHQHLQQQLRRDFNPLPLLPSVVSPRAPLEKPLVVESKKLGFSISAILGCDR
ncbi:T-box transcription factor TBX6-like [Toxorhynchites rutilus septentrionalis]|uniref:T-box transcription factor TBX6-like n=1 Tax=Toxorhynchites rutilus septentrionalis TaxID=329112 RepID=UPI002478496F|nr:T-box transcription factor TBX6-like [Toxorhynchites rutilus septentrionalis]